MKIKRQVDRKIGLNGRVKTHHQKLDRILKTHFEVKGTHQNGAAILHRANLKEWRVIAGLYEIALTINWEQARGGAFDLATQYHGC